MTMNAQGPVTPRSVTTLPQLVRSAASAYGDATLITLGSDDGPGEAISYAELERRSALLARGLMAKGAGKGSRIGFIAGNGPNFALWLAAIARMGAVAVPISTMIRSNELVRVLRQSDISGLIVQRSLLGYDYADRLCEALPELTSASSPDLRIAKTPFLRWICSTGEGLPAAIQDIAVLEAAASTVGEDILAEAEAEVHAADQMIEIYTSGSMALPKGVKHNHGPAMFRAQFMADITNVEQGKGYNCFLPMFWVGGLMMSLLPNWVAGAVTNCTERTMSNSRVAMGSVLAADDMALMAGAKPYWGLGMSETLGPYSYGDELRVPGYPLCAPMDHFADRYDIRIADENDQPVQDGEIGEMQVRGYALTPGLHKIERSEHFTPDGYYHTGDMCLVQGNRILFVGRNGDMIKSAGSNVSPGEVEMELQELDGVHSAYVVGLPDKERGQIVVAAIIPRDGAEPDYIKIEGELRKKLSSYKVPRAYLTITREEVPMLHSNKVSKRLLTEMVAERLGRPATV